jgi:hypothetical protein
MGDQMSWARAVGRAAIVIVVAVALFVVVPDRLLAYLSLHLVPLWRDVVMVCYGGVAFIAACVLFVRLQRVRT